GASGGSEDDEVVAHVFPNAFPFLGPRYRGHVVELRTRAVLVDLPVPLDEDDPIGWAAGIGCEARIVCLRGGRMLWDTKARVQRLAQAPGCEAVRAVLVAEQAPSAEVRHAMEGAVAIGG